MANSVYPPASRELSQKRRALAPDIEAAFDAFSQRVFADGALPAKTKQVIAVAVAHVTQCPYCIKGHTKAALRHGATPEELMEAIWVARRGPPAPRGKCDQHGQVGPGHHGIAEFRAALEPYGRWQRHARWGEVWTPADRPRDWRPYTVGHWAYTDNRACIPLRSRRV
jgi:AhpD family alkylhydroperoxidase